MFRDLEQIDHAKEPRLSRQCRSDVRKTDRRDRIHLDLTFFHRVPDAYSDAGTLPDSDAAGDFSTTNTFAKTLGEHHEESLHPRRMEAGPLWATFAGQSSCFQEPSPHLQLTSFLIWLTLLEKWLDLIPLANLSS